MNEHPNWKSYPKRSIICSTLALSAGNFGQRYFVIPEHGAKIGQCDAPDLWLAERFRKLYGSQPMELCSGFNSVVKYMTKKFDVELDVSTADVKTLDDLKYICKTVQKLFVENDADGSIRARLESKDPNSNDAYFMKAVNSDYDLYDALVTMFSPKSLDTKVINYPAALDEDAEVWTDAKCVLVKIDKQLKTTNYDQLVDLIYS
jgi:hypothetical protein